MELSRNYPEEHLQGLYNMREQDHLCDVTIHVEGRKFRAHKTVLAATGHYFLTMFTSGFRESSAQEITIEGSAAAFEILLNFVYTGRVDRKKVESCMSEVLDMACYMQFTAFVNICSAAVQTILEWAKEACSLSDVCKVMLLAKTHDLTAVYQAALRCLEDKVECLKCLDILLENISATFLEDFLCHEYLSNTNEEKHVLELVINWLKHDWEKRKGHSHQLLQKVRLVLVASEDIKKLIGPEILDIPGCSELVNRALDLHASKKPKEILAIKNPDIAAARSTIVAPVILNNDEFKYYDVKHKAWSTMKKMDPLRSQYCPIPWNIYELIVVKGVLYAAGGASGREFFKYQTSANKWAPLPTKPFRKVRFKFVALGAYIYAFSACCAPTDQVIERYDISAEKWEVLKVQVDSGSRRCTLLAEMPIDTDEDTGCKCSSHSAAEDYYKRCQIFAVAYEGKIFVSSLTQEEDDRKPYKCDGWGNLRCHYRIEGKLVIFDPVMNTYEMQDFGGGDSEDRIGNWDGICFKPTLFIYEDQLHWMMTQLNEEESYCYAEVTVERLRVTQEDGKTTVAKSDVKLELLHKFPNSENAPFCVQDYICVKQSGTAGSNTAGHTKVKCLPQYGEHKQLMYATKGSELFYPVWCSFEKKLVVPSRK